MYHFRRYSHGRPWLLKQDKGTASDHLMQISSSNERHQEAHERKSAPVRYKKKKNASLIVYMIVGVFCVHVCIMYVSRLSRA